MADHFAYIIARATKDGPQRPVKVGVTASPAARLSTLQTSSPFPLEIVFSFGFPNKDIARAAESAFHDVMGEHRTHGEWFDLTVLDAVTAMCLNIRAIIVCSTGLDPEMRERAYFLTGAWQAEIWATQERYRQAWVSQ